MPFENIKSSELASQEIVGQPHRHLNEGEAIKRIEREIDVASLAKKLVQPFADQVMIKIFGLLVLELKERFNQYDTILSDDASGRLVSLFFEKIINQQREEESKNKTKIYFLAMRGGRYSNDEVVEFIDSKKDELGRVLVVTEHMAGGRHMENLADILEKSNIDFDIVTISADGSRQYSDQVTNHLIYGTDAAPKGLAFFQYGGLGVKKDDRQLSPHPQRIKNPEAEKLGEARRNINILAEELSKLLK